MDFVVYAGDNTDVGGGTKVASGAELGQLDGVNWKRIGSRRLKGCLFRDFEWQPEAVQTVWNEDIDVVISLGYKSLSNILVRVICRLRRIPLIEWTQGVKRPERGLRWLVRKMYFKWADAFLLYGEFARDFFVRHGFRPEQLFIVRNSLDYELQKVLRERITMEEIRGCRAEFGVDSGAVRLVFNSGRLEHGKRVDLLIKSISLLKKAGRDVRLVLIGDGRERDVLQALCREHGVAERVHFCGACYDEEKLGMIISASDLCVVPGEVGLIAMHSLVYGTPVLSCDNTRGMHGPEVEAIIEGKTGRYFRDGDLDDLATKMDQMLYPVSCKTEMEVHCKQMIDSEYNPVYQEKVVIEALNYVLPTEKRIAVPD